MPEKASQAAGRPVTLQNHAKSHFLRAWLKDVVDSLLDAFEGAVDLTEMPSLPDLLRVSGELGQSA